MKIKKIFGYIGVISLMAFSFYYTNKIALFMNKEDKLMKEINAHALKYNKECTEGYITDAGVVLGVSGKVVDENLSYSVMTTTGFDASLIEYTESPCVVSKQNNIDDYIIGGNESKNSVSLIIDVSTGKNIEKLVSISKSKRSYVSILVDYNYYKNNTEYINKLINNNYDILYKGNDETEIKTLKNSLKSELFCVYTDDENLKELCTKNKVNTLKVNKNFNKEYLSNIKSDVKKGDFIILKESVNLVNEFGVIINYIKSRGLDVVTVTKHLSN